MFPDSLTRRFECEVFLPVGSWRFNLRATRRRYAETLGSLLRQPLQTPPHAQVDVEVELCDAPAASEWFPAAPLTEPTIARQERVNAHTQMLYTGWLRVFVDALRAPLRVTILVREPQYSERAFRDHLFEIFCKLLFLYDRFYVHAAALEFQGAVNLFVARGSNGKTTLSIQLANAGATILSEDHILLRRDAENQFWVSGCQDTLRVTAKTEQLLANPLSQIAVDAVGGPKKEIRVAELFSAAPYRDFPIHRVFFNRLGETFSIQPLSRRDAQLQLMYMTRSFFRHSDPDDLARYLDFFGALVRERECYALELSPDLSTLGQLVDFLRTRHV